MKWFKKKEEQGWVCLGTVTQDQIKELQKQISVLQTDMDWIKTELWIYKTICPKVDYRFFCRQPVNYLNKYDSEVAKLEKQGWHIKRVSDCGKYEIWMPPQEKETNHV